MNGYHDPYKGARQAAKVLIILLIVFAITLTLFQQARVKGAEPSPEPFWAPEGTVLGILYVSNGENLNTEYGVLLFPPDSPVGTLLVKDGLGNYVPAGEVTITYWVEPE